MSDKGKFEKLQREGLMTGTLPLHDEFITLLSKCVEDKQNLRNSKTELCRINSVIDNQITRVEEQQRGLLKEQMQITSMLLNGLMLPSDDDTHRFCRDYVYSLITKKGIQEEGD